MQKNNQVKIDFIGIGAQRAGTAWLYNNLRQIPEFDLPPVKEFHYFDRDPSYPSPNKLSNTQLGKRIFSFKFMKEVSHEILKKATRKDSKRLKFYLKWYFFNYNDNWYLSLFQQFSGFTGEITPSYSILKEKDVRRMYGIAPDAKIILLLRKPIDRAWSHYRFKTKNKANFSVEKLDDKDVTQFMEREDQLLRSNYLRTIDVYAKVYPKNQILICFYDAISECPQKLLSQIGHFISGNKPIAIEHLNLSRVFNKSRKIDRPQRIEDYLKEKFYSQIKQLAENYGGYFNLWLEETYGEKSNNSNSALQPTISMEKLDKP